jgi:outer membrane protein OmpA-like peptidoglycan-associated protein
VVVEEMKKTRAHALVMGNADEQEQAENNTRLAAQRAHTVAEFLRSSQIPKIDITVDSSNTTAPLESNRSQAGRDSNRQVDVYLVGP